jgi:hypothetical protein
MAAYTHGTLCPEPIELRNNVKKYFLYTLSKCHALLSENHHAKRQLHTQNKPNFAKKVFKTLILRVREESFFGIDLERGEGVSRKAAFSNLNIKNC